MRNDRLREEDEAALLSDVFKCSHNWKFVVSIHIPLQRVHGMPYIGSSFYSNIININTWNNMCIPLATI